MHTILQVYHLTKQFGKLTAVNDLSFQIESGKVYGLLGPNGSGKSTTSGMILNVINKTAGEVKWFEDKVSPSQALKKIGAIIERPNFYPYMTARQNLELVCKIKEISTENIDEKLQLVGLFERKNDKFKTFSLGMKQRLAIASALLNNPELLILDEPTNGLDPKGIHEIRSIIAQIAQKGKTIILASHLLDEVEKVCDRVIILQKGNKIFEGEVSEINRRQNWFEIETESIEKTLEILKKYPGIDKVVSEKNMIKAYVNEDLKGSQILQYLAQNDIYPESLIKRKPSLESRFLQITKENKV